MDDIKKLFEEDKETEAETEIESDDAEKVEVDVEADPEPEPEADPTQETDPQPDISDLISRIDALSDKVWELIGIVQTPEEAVVETEPEDKPAKKELDSMYATIE